MAKTCKIKSFVSHCQLRHVKLKTLYQCCYNSTLTAKQAHESELHMSMIQLENELLFHLPGHFAWLEMLTKSLSLLVHFLCSIYSFSVKKFQKTYFHAGLIFGWVVPIFIAISLHLKKKLY